MICAKNAMQWQEIAFTRVRAGDRNLAQAADGLVEGSLLNHLG